MPQKKDKVTDKKPPEKRRIYIIKAPNPNYEGVTFGVKFHRGIGKTDKKAVRDELVKNFGYIDITGKEGQ